MDHFPRVPMKNSLVSPPSSPGNSRDPFLRLFPSAGRRGSKMRPTVRDEGLDEPPRRRNRRRSLRAVENHPERGEDEPWAPSRAMLILFLAVLAGMVGPSNGLSGPPPSPSSAATLFGSGNGSYVSAFYVLGDSSVDCGDNSLFYPFLHGDLSLHPCNDESDKSLVPHFLGTASILVPLSLSLSFLRFLNFCSLSWDACVD